MSWREWPLPQCKTHKEDIMHVHTCTHTLATKAWTEAELAFLATLQETTPTPLIQGIKYALTKGTSHRNHKIPTDLPDRVLEALTNQADIGWAAFLQGHISHSWVAAYDHLTSQPNTKCKHKSLKPRTWGQRTINGIWKYSKAIWANRNAVVHGNTEEATQSKMRQQQKQQVDDYFQEYNTNPHFIPSSRTYLFNKSQDELLHMDRETIICWIRSVEEAKLTQEAREDLHRKQLRKTLYKYFKPTTSRPPFFNPPALPQAACSKARKRFLIEPSYFQPPFSKSYYTKHRRQTKITPQPRHNRGPPNNQPSPTITRLTLTKRKTRTTLCTATRSRAPKQQVLATAQRNLWSYGFSSTGRNSFSFHTFQQQTAEEQKRLDFSGTYVSSTPWWLIVLLNF